MKKSLKFVLIATLLLLLVLGTSASFNNGTFTASAPGFHGDITVKVVVERNAIKTVEIVSHTETAGIGTRAITMLPSDMVEEGTWDVDTVSGCTETSKGIIAAVKKALGQ